MEISWSESEQLEAGDQAETVETVETLTGPVWKLGTSQVTGGANRPI